MGIFNRQRESGREQEILDMLPKRFRGVARGVARQAAGFLDEDEPILAVFYGNGDGAPAIITVSKFGWSFVQGGFGNYVKQSPSIGRITGVSATNERGGNSLSVEVGGDTFTVRQSAGNAEEVARIIRAQVDDFNRLMADLSEDEEKPEQSDRMAELKNLAELHAAGVLTDDEFAAAKARILGI